MKMRRFPTSFELIRTSLALFCALAMQPEVILFDEVTAALDPETVKEVLL